MASKRKSKQAARRPRRPLPSPADSLPEETRAAETLTIGWMLSTLATTVATLLALALLVAGAIGAKSPMQTILAGLITYLALASGLVTLALTGPAVRLRRVKPPLAITIYAVTIGLAPLLLLAILRWVG